MRGKYPVPAYLEANNAGPARAGRLLQRLVEKFPNGTLILALTRDEQTGDQSVEICFNNGETRRHAVREGMEDALLCVVDEEPAKRCSGCRQEKKLIEFAKNRRNPDGRNYRCRVCERARVKNYTTRTFVPKEGPRVRFVDRKVHQFSFPGSDGVDGSAFIAGRRRVAQQAMAARRNAAPPPPT